LFLPPETTTPQDCSESTDKEGPPSLDRQPHLHPLQPVPQVSSQEELMTAEDTESRSVRTSLLVSSTGLGLFMAGLDESIMSVALPSISEHFGVEQLRGQWVVLVYLLVLVSLTAFAGYLGDRISTKLVFQIGMIIFAVGSLLCALSHSLGVLVAFRILQAIGATGMLANGMALVTRFTTTENRGFVIGLTSLISALGVVFGPVIGALLTQYVYWQSIFLINLPYAVIGFFLVQFALPKTPPFEDNEQASDFLGSLLFAFFMTALIGGITIFAESSFQRRYLWSGLLLGSAILFLVAFLFWESRSENPFIDIVLFRNRKFTVGVLCAIVTYLSLNSVAFQLPFFAQDILNYEPIKIAYVVICVPIGLGITAPLAGKLSNKIDTRYITTFALGFLTALMLVLTLLLSKDISLWILILIALGMGLGIGAFTSPNGNSVLSSVPKEKLGVISGLLNLSRNIGFSIGTALSTTIFTSILLFYQERNGGDLYSPVNYIPSMKIVFVILTIVLLLAAVISFFRGLDDKKEELEETRESSSLTNSESTIVDK
jgi:EmrB/QacA subfamily drug resistance transporter